VVNRSFINFTFHNEYVRLLENICGDNRFKKLMERVKYEWENFEAIHPFRDGNGRTGRVFNINYLTKKGLLDVSILFLSRYILDHKEDYYPGFSGVSQRGNWKDWLLFMLKAIEYTSMITSRKSMRLYHLKIQF